ncbi:MAG: AI-2E family transporter [Candidatus Krumholzibacteriota bacterium]|nr:AI-2E family transporter [Candidatus Krumholzibacteriota bacterium]
MESGFDRSRASQTLLTVAAFVVVVAGLRASSQIVVPFLLAAFISIICSAPLFWMRDRGIHAWIAIVVIIAGAIFAGFIIASLLGSSIDDFSTNIPKYGTALNDQYGNLLKWLESRGMDISNLELVEVFNPQKAMQLVGKLFNSLGEVLTNGLLIILTVIFMLLEASSIPAKLHSVFRNPDDSIAQLGRITSNIKNYLAIKTVISLITGVLVAVMLSIFQVDYPLLWGLLAFLLNYVPNIGSIIAAIPPVLLALIQYGVGRASGVAIVFLLINLIMGNLVEPRFMGKGLGLSTLVVFLSLIFWGWVLGPVGMLLSVVLTVTMKIVLESREDTRWIAVLLGSHLPPGPSGSGDKKAD